MKVEEFLKTQLKSRFYKHQQKAFDLGIKLNQSAFLMEQGTGKTFPAIAVAHYRFVEGQVKKLLIVTPLSVTEVWEDEFKKFAGFKYRFSILDKKGRKKNLLLQDPPDYLWVAIINYESSWRCLKEIMRWKPDMVICDESQKIKKGTAKQSRGLHRLGDKVKYKLILTGTPITQNPLDLFSQYKFLNPEIFGRRFLPFRDRYARMGGYFGYEIIGYRNLKELSRKANKIAYRITQDEALDLPPVINQELRFELSGRALYYYQKMKKDLIIELRRERVVTAPIILTKILRLQQITGGYLPLGEKKYIKVNNTKFNQLKELLEALPSKKKVVIFARFLMEMKEIGRICREMKREVLFLSGKTENRGKVIKRFQKGREINTLIAQIQTGGLGISLNKAEVVVFYSTTFSYADYDQAKARAHRIGQTKTVTYIHLITKGTVDEKILTTLKEKWSIAKFVIDILPTLSGERRLTKKWEKLLKT
jgi:SNF2 family DNA or RNA helicase